MVVNMLQEELYRRGTGLYTIIGLRLLLLDHHMFNPNNLRLSGCSSLQEGDFSILGFPRSENMMWIGIKIFYGGGKQNVRAGTIFRLYLAFVYAKKIIST